MGLPMASLELCLSTLYGFVGKQVMIKGIIELETTFRERSHAHNIPILYTVVDVEASLISSVQTQSVNLMSPPSRTIAMEGRRWSTVDSQEAKDQVHQSVLASQSVPFDNLRPLSS
ncbi:hypothetical protein CR513_46373, partial [Mucuna pruriens]